MPAGGVGGPISFPIVIPALPSTVQRYGVRNATDVVSFLTNEWLDRRGMNNCLLYGIGVWQNNAAGNTAPFSTPLTVNATDSITGTVEASVSTTEWKANGVLPATTSLSPTLGSIWMINGKGTGGADWQSQRLFSTGADTSWVQSSWKSYIDIGAMWIGDTPAKRCVWSGAGAASAEYPVTLSGRSGTAIPTGLPMIPGTSTTYTETTSASPPLVGG